MIRLDAKPKHTTTNQTTNSLLPLPSSALESHFGFKSHFWRDKRICFRNIDVHILYHITHHITLHFSELKHSTDKGQKKWGFAIQKCRPDMACRPAHMKGVREVVLHEGKEKKKMNERRYRSGNATSPMSEVSIDQFSAHTSVFGLLHLFVLLLYTS